MDKRFEKWERIRKKGKWHFIFVHGALLWGLCTALTLSILFLLVFGPMTGEQFRFWIVLPIALIICPLGGIAWGYSRWARTEKAFQNLNKSPAPKEEKSE